MMTDCKEDFYKKKNDNLFQDLLKEETLTLDCLFHMQSHELDQLVLKHSIADVERKKLYHALDHLSLFYGKYHIIMKCN